MNQHINYHGLHVAASNNSAQGKKYFYYKRPIFIGIIVFAVIVLMFISFCVYDNINNDIYNDGETIVYKGETYKYNNDNLNIAIIGYDQNDSDCAEGRSGQCDFLLLMVLDTSTGHIKIISVPRDTMTQVTEYAGSKVISNDKIMQIAFSYGYGDGKEKSCEHTVDSLSRLFNNVPIRYYFSLNMKGIAPLNDAVGGVTLVPLETIPENPIVNPENPILENQETTLNGNDAVAYVRYRDTSDLYSAEKRRERQIQYLDSFINQALNNSDRLQTVINLYNVSKEYSTTNLGLAEFINIAQSILDNGVEDYEMINIPGEVHQGKDYVEYIPDKNKLFEIVLNTFYEKQ